MRWRDGRGEWKEGRKEGLKEWRCGCEGIWRKDWPSGLRWRKEGRSWEEGS